MLLVVDNGSVYTKSILDFLQTTNIEFVHLHYDKILFSNLGSYSSIILSGRRKNNVSMNAINSKLIKYSLGSQTPLLGICYGAEILALTLGGTIRKMDVARQGIYEINVTRNNPLCNGKIDAFESHSYMVSKLDSSFTQIAKSTNCEFEIFQVNDKNIFGTQFHPEMSKDGRVLLGKFASIQ